MTTTGSGLAHLFHLACVCSGVFSFLAPSGTDISTKFQEADDALFRSILSNNVLHTFLSERPETTYSLRTRSHNKLLIPQTSNLDDRHFIIRSLYKNLYWCDLTHQTKLLCWHCYIYAELLLYFILARPICVALYTFMNFVHSCVWQLFLKNKRWDEMRWDDCCNVNRCESRLDKLHCYNS